MADRSEKDFYEKGFLGNQVTEVTEAILKKHQAFFDTCYKANELAYATLFETEINNQDLQQVLAVTLFIRLLNGFQSIVILAKLGLAFDAKVVLRGVLESLFIEKLLCENKDFALEYVKSDECSRLKWLNIARKSSAPHFNLLREIATDEKVEKLKTEIDQQGCKEIAVEDVARRAGLQIEYDTAYRILCEETHTLPRSIQHLTVIDNSGDPVEFDPHPTDKDLPFTLFTAIRLLHIALVSLCHLCAINKEKQLQEINEALKELGPQVKVRTDSTLSKPA